MVSARFFGAGKELDAYLIAFLLPSFLSDVLAGAILQSAMPETAEASRELRQQRELYASVLYTGLQMLSAIAVLMAILSPWALKILASVRSANG